MPDITGLETHQERLVRQGQEATRYAVVQHALALLAPAADLTTLSYPAALRRLMDACQGELHRLEEETPDGR
jgi:hypothetical protein